jgi:hypothetical protein
VSEPPPGAGLEESADRHGAFPRLDADQRARLRAAGRLRVVDSGEILFREGDPGYDFFVVESGAVVVVQGYGAENRVVAVHDEPAPRLRRRRVSAPARSSGSSRRSAKARWRCASFTSVSRRAELAPRSLRLGA